MQVQLGQVMGALAALGRAAPGNVIVVGTWGGEDARNEWMREAALDGDAEFVAIDEVRTQPGCQAYAEYGPGPVGWHPSDLGMALIAERVIAQFP